MQCDFEWSVIGAGPAGIAAVGQLLDAGVPPQSLAWIDPQFQVGDFGTKWANVTSNTKVKLFRQFLHACQSFHTVHDKLSHIDDEQTCQLKKVAEPLLEVTHHLRTQVTSFQNFAQHLSLHQQRWHIQLNHAMITARRVILATGADPILPTDASGPSIPLDVALDPTKLKHAVQPRNRVAVIGSSHSAIMAIWHLVDAGVEVINVYRSPLKFAIDFGDWILHDNTGLKGQTADWARRNILNALPPNLKRITINDPDKDQYLDQCHRTVYAIGFQQRDTCHVEGLETLNYQPQSGIIAPGLFGLGIGFPEYHIDRLGIGEYRVGLKKFMDYIQRVLPIWLSYPP